MDDVLGINPQNPWMPLQSREDIRLPIGNNPQFPSFPHDLGRGTSLHGLVQDGIEILP